MKIYSNFPTSISTIDSGKLPCVQSKKYARKTSIWTIVYQKIFDVVCLVNWQKWRCTVLAKLVSIGTKQARSRVMYNSQWEPVTVYFMGGTTVLSHCTTLCGPAQSFCIDRRVVYRFAQISIVWKNKYIKCLGIL